MPTVLDQCSINVNVEGQDVKNSLVAKTVREIYPKKFEDPRSLVTPPKFNSLSHWFDSPLPNPGDLTRLAYDHFIDLLLRYTFTN